MNKKTTFSALTLFISASISLIAVGLIKNQSLYASNDYIRTFTFDKTTPLEFIDEDGIYYFSGKIDVDKNNNRYISYDIYGYANSFTCGGNSFIAGAGDDDSLSFQGDLYVNGLKSVSITISKLNLSYGYGAFDLRARVKDNASIEEIVEVNKIGTTEYIFDSTKGFDVLYINAYCYNELIIDSITLTYDCASFYSK